MPMMNINEQAFLAALERWMIERWRPQERFNGEFDDAVFATEARYGINDELAATFDRLKPNARYKSGTRKGYVRIYTARSFLNGLAGRGLLKRRGTWDGWFDIVEGVLD